MNARYRLPESVKERQAQDLKRRLSNYLGEPPRQRRKAHTLKLVLLAVIAWAAWKFLKT